MVCTKRAPPPAAGEENGALAVFRRGAVVDVGADTGADGADDLGDSARGCDSISLGAEYGLTEFVEAAHPILECTTQNR